MQYFITVLTDTCKVGNHTYIINTQIHHFTYHIEVFKDGKAINSIQAISPEPIDTVFHAFYILAHQTIRNKYCTPVKKYLLPLQEAPIKLLPKPEQSQKNILKITIVSVIILSLFMYFYFTTLIYSNLYIDIVYSNKKEQITYLEQIESKTHTLSKTCLALSKKKILENEIFTISKCQKWCQKEIIQKDTCDLALAYIKQNYPPSINNMESMKTSLGYVVLPQGSLILSNTKDVALQINNISHSPLKIIVKNIILEKNTHEEIVQFRHAISTMQLNANKTKKIFFFLEPSYYVQFKKGNYSGHIEFEILHKGKKSTFLKKFSFVVK